MELGISAIVSVVRAVSAKAPEVVAVAIFLECSQQAHENAAGIFGSRRAYRHHNASPQEWIQQRIVRGKRGATRSTLVRRVRKCRLRTWLKQQSLNARRSCATGDFDTLIWPHS